MVQWSGGGATEPGGWATTTGAGAAEGGAGQGEETVRRAQEEVPDGAHDGEVSIHTLYIDKCVRLLILGDHLFNLLPRLLFCTRTILKKGWMHPFLQIILIQFILYFKLSYCKIAQRGKEFNEFCLSNSSDDLCLFFCIYPSSMLETLLFGKETQTKLNTKCKNKFCHN